ncbi:hypothetical protein [Brachybacterium phenoliresistens]|uniref:Uncharacterized protein n=1 Tax=Brachybacterium phenoliresistens TaxID=396014 RepID=Z9JVX6_9MICO|nr:hypothetical protein [Brachybacterium phenoliresistens]EWS81946.1 hypothetical protein BF93_14050 [Brachybacterium phenoliresistens]
MSTGRKVVISSVTGKPIPWEDEEPASAPGRSAPLFPDRVAEDAPEPGTDESNDARLAQDVPPHWGTGA